ncbi:hypothetical protein ACTXPN_14675, partial [Brachybacterium alimentarium]|uniref:hypothetical protein n=1 Tax=Brachybacterium alimentarium TaxID=47845 RepID=UPI003FD6BA9C
LFDLENVTRIGQDARIYQQTGQASYRYTDARFEPTDPLRIVYSRHDLWTRPNTILTITEVELGAVPESDLGGFVTEGLRRARQALAAAITVLDERIANRFIAFQIAVATPDGVAIIDSSDAVRCHDQSVTRRETVTPALENLSEMCAPDDATAAALSCYLAALEHTLTPPGLMLLVGALEVACLGVEKHGTGFNKKGLCDELDRLGIPNDSSEIGRLIAGPRGTVVHQGFQPHHQLREAWYLTERLLRAVLQVKLGTDRSWPADPPLEPDGVPYAVVELYDAEGAPTAVHEPPPPGLD